MRRKKIGIGALFCIVILVISIFSAMPALSYSDGETDIVLIRINGLSDTLIIRNVEANIIDRYGRYALVEADTSAVNRMENLGLSVDRMPDRNVLSIKGHLFDLTEGMPDFPAELTADGYAPGEEGLYIVHMIGPVNPEWRVSLEEAGVDIINYQPNYAYEVWMTPEIAEEVEDLFFVNWVGVYQPGFKIANGIDPGMIDLVFYNGDRAIVEIQNENSLIELANMNDVYYISQYIEPQLYDEMATQTIGGGLWVFDDDNNPDTAYRAYGNYGSYANQIGYDGAGIVTAVADTGLGDGTTPNAGHLDFTGRVLGGYSFDGGGWQDGHGHGTHCTGSVAGDTYHGTGQTVYNDYYAGQGSAPETDLFAVKIFDDGGGWIGPEDLTLIVSEARSRSGAYVHSNSWGASTGGAYDDRDSQFDQVARDAGDGVPMVLVIAAGNDGPGNRGGYNSIGSPGNAKNVITVGATRNYPDGSPDDIAGFSSRGWTDDNRVKPDVTAPGEQIYSTAPNGGYQYMSGTSMAAPAVSGAATVVVDWYESTYLTKPSPAMVKSLMVNTAYNSPNDNGGINSPHIPNQDEGWGMVNLPMIVSPPANTILYDHESLLTTGNIDEFEIEYDDASEPLRISLSWMDRYAAGGDNPSLKNDLNLEVIPPTGDSYYGNGLVESWSVKGQGAVLGFDNNGDNWDDRNTVENVFVRSGELETGTYTVRVHGFNVPEDANNDGTANQDYALVMYNAVPASTDPGPLPPTNPIPVDGATGVGTDPELSVYVEHEDGNLMDVHFYDASNNGLIGTDDRVNSGARASVVWNGLNLGTTYSWYAVAEARSDGQTATSATWSFTTAEPTPPSITLTRPTGGEIWTSGTNEDIMWSTTAGDGTITGIDLDYSIDGGTSWTNIVTGTADDGVHTWLVPDEPTIEAQIRATVNDDLGLSGTDTSGNFEIVGTIPPSITLTRPTGGETWYAGTNEDIMWSTTAGDGTITGINLDYSIDGGASWTNIVTGTADDGVHTWLVPDEATIEAQIRATVNDDLGLSDTDTSGNFAIIGTPPTSPTGLTVEHYGAGDAVELVDNGIFDTNYDPWTLTRVQDEGDARWDADNYVEGGSIYVTAEQTGDGTADEEAYWEQSIGPTSDEITVNAAYRIYASTERGCGVDTTVELRVHDTNTGWQTIYTETINLGVEDIHDPGWLVFGPDATYAPDGDVDAVMAYMHVHADGNTHPGQGAQTATGDAWMDAISIEAAGGGGSGTDDNAVNWTASTDDPAKVTHYNIYRSDVETGPWDATTLIDTVTADGSVSYSYIDTGRGTADTTLWWYVVRAEDEHGQTDGNSNAVQEPGEETITFDIDLFAGGNADGWNFVSFNLELGDTNLETILADIEGSYDKVMYYDASAGQWQSYVPGRAAHYNNIDTWNHHMGLWIHATVDDTLTVEGSAPMSTDITLYPGWNMVGLPSNTAGTGQTHGLPQDVSRIGYFDATNEYNIAYNYDPQNFEFNPGQGYMVYLDHTEPVIWTVDY